MDRTKEDCILERAAAKGLVHPEGLKLLDQMLRRYGPRLGALIGIGRLDMDAVRQIEQELEGEEVTVREPLDTTVRLGSAGDTHYVIEGSSRQHGRWTGTRCGHYEVAELLGQGGMGEVYRAHDPVLKRNVAVKFLHDEDPRLLARFLQEARLQARVEHEHICKVYEAGEFDGKPYIVMQLIDGQTLANAGDAMSLEQQVTVMLHVSEAVHAAHKLGLIHRDLKPTNIMVEKTEDGSWKPYVMDFGLARDVEGPGTTTTGQAVGTPSYMAPEQAQGRSSMMDRRTDVYGLGATLYHVLTRRPPFDGASGVEIMMKLIQEDPAPLRRLVPSLPADLETIVMKCLEKEPGRRYDSAHAVAEELRRYLDGEPILARRASWTYRAAKTARKHKALVAVSSVALVAVLVLGAVGLQARLTAARQARLAQEFGQEVERIDAIIRTAVLLPLHDIRPEKERVRKALRRIEDQMKVIGAAAEAPENFALGRGNMALGNYGVAATYLRKAWHAGLSSTDVASALGLTLGYLYKEQLEAAERIEDQQGRERRLKQIEAEYCKPAVTYLEASRGSESSAPDYVEGLIAFYKKDNAVALEKSRAAFTRDPSLYDAKMLEGDVRSAIATACRNAGDYDGAQAAYDLADGMYRDAARIGESDPRCYQRLCSLWTNLMEIDLYGRKGDLATHLKKALDASDSGLAADPEDAGVQSERSVTWL